MYKYTYFLLVALLVLVSSSFALDSSPYDCPTCFKVRVGRAEYMYGPVNDLLDNPFNSMVLDGVALGYSANGETKIIMKGDSIIPDQTAHVALETGESDQFDSCGAWLNSVVSDDNIVRGWYHAETKCDYSVGQTYKSVAYCESSDGGVTFEKKGYPDNQILTGTEGPVSDANSGNGDLSIVTGDDGYYYAYFIDWDSYGYCVARSLITSGGGPGTWTKYYNGDWSQPGLNGTASGLSDLVGASVYKHESGNFFGVGSGNGITLSFGGDAVSWDKLSVPIVYAAGSEWVRTSNSTELLGYPAFVATTGGSQDALGDTFWLYYTYLEPGAYFSDRYLIRREVVLSSIDDDTTSTAQAGVELSRYTDGEKSWSTTTAPLESNGNFTYDSSLGYLLTSALSGSTPLYDCYIESWDDYIVTPNSEACSDTGVTYLRQLGWVYKYKQTGASPVYRCFNADTLKHSVSQSTDCDGNGKLEFILGYTLDD